MQGLNSHKLIFPYRNVVSYLIQTSQWPTLLRQSWEKHPKTTPFRELIKKMPGKVKPKQHRAWCLCQKLALFPRVQFWFYLTMTVMKQLFLQWLCIIILIIFPNTNAPICFLSEYCIFLLLCLFKNWICTCICP